MNRIAPIDPIIFKTYVNYLTPSCEKLKAENARLNEELAKIRKQVAGTNSVSHDAVHQCQKTIDEQKEHIAQLERRFEASNEDLLRVAKTNRKYMRERVLQAIRETKNAKIIEQLKAELAAAEASHDEAIARLEKQATAYRDLSAQLEASRVRVNELDGVRRLNDELVRNVETCTAKLKSGETIESQQRKLKEVLDAQGAAVNAAREELTAKHQKEAEGIVKKVVDLEERLAILKREKEALENSVRELTADKGNLDRRIGELEKALQEHEETIRTLREDKAALDAIILKNAAKVEELNREREKTTRQAALLSAHSETQEVLTREKAALEDRIRDVEGARDETIRDLKDRLRVAIEDAENAKNANNAKELTDREDVQMRLEKANNALEVLQERVDSLQTSKVSAESQTDPDQIEKDTEAAIETLLKEKSREVQDRSLEIEKLLDFYKSLADNMESTRAHQKSLNELLERQSGEILKLRGDLKSKGESRDESRDEYEKNLAQASKRLAEIQREHDAAVETTKKEITDLKERAERSEASLATSNQEHARAMQEMRKSLDDVRAMYDEEIERASGDAETIRKLRGEQAASQAEHEEAMRALSNMKRLREMLPGLRAEQGKLLSRLEESKRLYRTTGVPKQTLEWVTQDINFVQTYAKRLEKFASWDSDRDSDSDHSPPMTAPPSPSSDGSRGTSARERYERQKREMTRLSRPKLFNHV